MQDNQTPKYLIVGAGIFGVSTAWHLSLRYPDLASSGQIVLLDRTPFPPKHAASTDINKIVRQDYSVPFYMALATKAYTAWTTWPSLSPLFHRTGWIAFNPKGTSYISAIRANFRARGIDPTRDVSLDEARSMCGGVYKDTDFSEVDGAYWNPDAGWADAASAVQVMTSEAIARGVRYIVGDVDQLLRNETGDGLKGVRLADGSIVTAQNILLATGAWTSKLMTTLEDELSFPDNERVESQIKASGVAVAHYKMTPQEMYELRDLPVTVYGHWGDMQPEPRARRLKLTDSLSVVNTITTPTGHRISCPPEREQSIISPRMKRELTEIMPDRLLPQYLKGRTPEYWRICWDAATPTQDWVVDRHPRRDVLENLYFAVGGSFHSWKFLPIAGEYVCNVLEGKSSGEEEDRRFAWKDLSKPLGKGAHEKAYPIRELRDVEGGGDVRANL